LGCIGGCREVSKKKASYFHPRPLQMLCCRPRKQAPVKGGSIDDERLLRMQQEVRGRIRGTLPRRLFWMAAEPLHFW
jgi:hypothetical protein